MVCSVVRNAPYPLPVLCADREGERFHIVVGLYCNSGAKGRQVISVSYMAQKLGDCKQKKLNFRTNITLFGFAVLTINVVLDVCTILLKARSFKLNVP